MLPHRVHLKAKKKPLKRGQRIARGINLVSGKMLALCSPLLVLVNIASA